MGGAADAEAEGADAMSAMSRDFRSLCRLVLTAILVLIATAAAYQQLGRPCIGVDDANITLVYARNLSRGHGFVYTPGGERVEDARRCSMR